MACFIKSAVIKVWDGTDEIRLTETPEDILDKAASKVVEITRLSCNNFIEKAAKRAAESQQKD